ncbi:MAG: hypothetical protein ACREBI_00425 [Nitrosotalea sp.]
MRNFFLSFMYNSALIPIAVGALMGARYLKKTGLKTTSILQE